MFERFAAQARQAVKTAVNEAKEQGADRVGCEHLLIGLAQGRSGPAADSLSAAGVNLAMLRELIPGQPAEHQLDAESLAVLGIDLDQVRRAAEAAFGPGALDRPARESSAPFRFRLSPDCKKAVELAVRQVHRGHDRAISSGHLLIGLIDQGNNEALRLLKAAHVDHRALRADTVRRMADAA